jgi:hypothetical protein
MFVLDTESRRTQGSTQPIQLVPGEFSLGVKRPWLEDVHSPASSVQFKNGRAKPPLPLRLHGVVSNQLSRGTTLHLSLPLRLCREAYQQIIHTRKPFKSPKLYSFRFTVCLDFGATTESDSIGKHVLEKTALIIALATQTKTQITMDPSVSCFRYAKPCCHFP